MSTLGTIRAASSSLPTWSEELLDAHRAGATSLVDSIALGHSLLRLHTLGTAAEVDAVRAEVFSAEADGAARRAIPRSDLKTGHRLTMDSLDASAQELCDELLLRACSLAEEAAPGLMRVLFGADVIDATT